jgi:hypothetical protein
MKRSAFLLLLALVACLLCAGCSMSNNYETPLAIGTATLPTGTVGTVYSYSVPVSGGTPPYVWSVSGTLPAGLTLSTKGVISGTPVAVGTTGFTLSVTDSEAVPAGVAANFSLTIQGGLTVSTTTLPAGTVGVSYTATLTASGGITPYTWSLPGGGLPPGLNLSSTGVISGTPTATGTFSFGVQVDDSEPSGQVAQGELTITVSAIGITTQSLPAAAINVPYSQTLAAVGGTQPYTWTLSSGSLPAGLTLSSAGVISGTPTAAGSSTFTVQVADSEHPPATASAQLSITVNSGGNGGSGSLQGNYAFYLNGFNSAGLWTLAGSFVAVPNGNIASGVVDGNSLAGEPFESTITGTYSLGNGLNTMTIQGPSWGPMTLAFVLDSTGNGRIIEYDDTTGQGSRGSGVLREANPSAFSLASLNGGWAFGMTGAGSSGERLVQAGQFVVSAGNIPTGSCDVNDGGVYGTCSFDGTLSTVDPLTGRATATLETSEGTIEMALYVVSGSEAVMEQIDPVSGSNGVLVGSVLQQIGPFSNGSLSGTAVLYLQDIHQGDGLDDSQAGIVSFDGGGNFDIVAMDEDLAGTITDVQPSPGTYTVANNGAVTMSCAGGICPVGFLVNQNQGFFVGTGASSTFGVMEEQSGAPFSNASLAGAYAGGSLAPLDYANALNDVVVGSADGLGTFTSSGYSSSFAGRNQYSSNVANYNVADNGRGTLQGQGDPVPGIVYMISPGRWVVLQPTSDARVEVYQH